jgi:quinol monooxygenase YgiN
MPQRAHPKALRAGSEPWPHDDPDTWVMLEMFRSRAAWHEHIRPPYNTEGNKSLEDLLREPSDLRLFDEK